MKQHRRLPSEAKVDSPFAKIQKKQEMSATPVKSV